MIVVCNYLPLYHSRDFLQDYLSVQCHGATKSSKTKIKGMDLFFFHSKNCIFGCMAKAKKKAKMAIYFSRVF